MRRLLEYEQMKRAAMMLGDAPVAGRDFSVVEVYVEQAMAERLPGIAVADLSEAWRSILARAKMTKHHKITREQLSVRSHMSRILRTLSGGAFTEFSLLFEPEQGVPVLVVSFLALLEKAKREGVRLVLAEPQFQGKALKTLAEAIGARVAVLYTATLDARVRTYLDLLRHNLRALCP